MELPVEELTLSIDVPLDQAGAPAMYVVAKEQTTPAAKSNVPSKAGTCREYRANNLHSVRPIFVAEDYFLKYKKGPAVVAWEGNNLTTQTETQIEVAKQPRHGSLSRFKPEATGSNLSKYDYHYTPNKDYVGLDNFEFLVSVDGKSLRVYYQVKVFPEDENPNFVGYCNWQKPTWKISQSTSDASTADLAVWQRASDLSTLLATASQSLTGFSGSSVGNTVGEGATASITLDPTAAGHGWYVDATPSNGNGWPSGWPADRPAQGDIHFPLQPMAAWAV